MTKSYTIQSGDTLLQIAIDQQVEFTELLVLNPQYQTNPDWINVGESLTLPEPTELVVPEADFSIEPPSTLRPLEEKGCIESTPECKKKKIDVVDVIFVTGDSPTDYYCLDEKAQKLLLEEAKVTEQLIKDYSEILNSAPKGDNLTSLQLQEHALKKKAWLEKAIYAGAIKVPEPSQTAQDVNTTKKAIPPTQATVESKISALKKRVRIIDSYVPFFSQSSTYQLKNKVVKRINDDIEYWQSLLKTPQSKESSNKQSVNLDRFQEGTFKGTRPSRHVVEVWVASQDKLIYIRADFFKREEKAHWVQNAEKTAVTKALKAKDWGALKTAFKTDIKKGISDDIDARKLDLVFKNWKADGWKCHEWKGTQTLSNDDGEVIMAVSEEAQLFRFAAQASVKAELKPTKGDVDIGIGAEASFALAEGAVSLSRYLPYESGYAVTLSYTDANKQPAVYPFGCFRANITMMLSCFVGVMGQGKFSISNVPNPNPGHQILLSPTVTMGNTPNTGVGVKAEAFGGAQAGGQIEGGLEWKAPPDLEQDKTFNFSPLAKIGANGNISLGAGARYDFQLALVKGKFYFNCSGQLVFGPGGGGGFGTMIDVEQLWALAVIVLKGLKAIDYRLMQNINSDAYEFIMKSSYAAFAAEFIESPKDALKNALTETNKAIDKWWDIRLRNWKNDTAKRQEVGRIADRIIASTKQKGTFVTGDIPLDELPPESVGMMLNTLVTTFYTSFEEKQETAIYILLMGMVRSWRRFEEILARMNPEGKKQSGDKALFKNLDRINTILDGEQQNSFNQWVKQLAQQDKITTKNFAQLKPYTPKTGNAFRDKYPLIKTQVARLNNHSGDVYV